MESSKEKISVFNFGRGLLEKYLKDVGAIWGEECLQEQGTAEARGMSLICFRNTMGVKCGWNLLSKDTVAGGEVIHLLNKHLLSSNWVSLSSKTLPVLCYCAKSLPLCPTLCDPMDCIAHQAPWYSPGKNTEVGCHFPLQGIFLPQGLNSTSLKSSALTGGSFTTSATSFSQF